MDKKKAVYVPTVGEEVANAVSHGVMSFWRSRRFLLPPCGPMCMTPAGFWPSVSVSVFVISIF